MTGFISDIVAAKPRGIVQVGANVGQEYEDYKRFGVPMLFFEPLVAAFCILHEKVHRDENAKAELFAVGSFCGIVSINESDKGGVSSSILQPSKHLTEFPNRKFKSTRCHQITLDSYFDRNPMLYDTMVMDVQGYELHVLNGAVETLKSINLVVSEVWHEQLYVGSAMHRDIDEFMLAQGFECGPVYPAKRLFSNAVYFREQPV